MKILVTGATGFVGFALIRYLDDYPDFTVVGGVRSLQNRNHNLSLELREFNLDSTDLDLTVDLSDIDVIVHTAGRAHVMSETARCPIHEFRRINTAGTLRLAQAAANSGVKRFVFLSSIKVNGESSREGLPFSVASRENPSGPYGISKYEAELGLKEIANQTDLEVVVIRPPLVYGPGVKGNVHSLIKVLNCHIPLPFALVRDNRRSMVGIDNLLSLIAVCAQHPRAANQTFFVSDNSDLSTYDFVRLLGEAVDRPARMFPVPVSVMESVARFFGLEDRVRKLIGTLQVDISQTCKRLDWEPPVDLEQGLKKIKSTS